MARSTKAGLAAVAILVASGASLATDGAGHFSAARASCARGDLETAERHLLKAVKAGFQDFSTMARDPQLAPLRDRGIYRSIVAARQAADPILARRRIDDWRRRYGDDAYRFERDQALRITIAVPKKDPRGAALPDRVRSLADHLQWWLFDAPLRQEVLVGLLAEEDLPAAFGNPHVRGNYQHGLRLLRTADAGRALAHELVHVFHHADMDRVGQQHPMWIQEGLAGLYESFEIEPGGGARFHPNDRDVAVAHLDADGRLPSLEEVLGASAQRFRDEPLPFYAVARSVLAYVADQASLPAWYVRYKASFDSDITGVEALESVLGAPMEAIESRWRVWIRDRGPAALAMEHADRRWDAVARAGARGGSPEPIAPTPEQRVYRVARDHYAVGRYGEAIEHLEQVIRMDPCHAVARYEAALAHVRLAQPEPAREHLRVLLELDPSLASLLANLLRQ